MSNQEQLKALRPNVGFLLKETAGYTWSLEIDLSATTLADETHLEWLRGQLELTRIPQGVWVDGALEGGTPAECARCLSPFTLPLTIQLQELFYYPPSNTRNSSEYMITEDGCLDLVEPMQEQLALSIPIQPVCRPDCRGLCSRCGQDLNLGDCNCKEETTDPRLAILQQFRESLSDE